MSSLVDPEPEKSDSEKELESDKNQDENLMTITEDLKPLLENMFGYITKASCSDNQYSPDCKYAILDLDKEFFCK